MAGLLRVELEAVNWLRDYGTGDTRPQLFVCRWRQRGDERWVLKLMGKADRELAADWIGSLLAHRLGLRLPQVAIADLTPAALRTCPADVRSWARPGPAFASRELADASPVVSNAEMVALGSPEELGMMYALDAWLDVVDRRKPDGVWNVLVDTASGQLNVLDFGKALASAMFVLFGDAEPICDPLYPDSVKFAASRGAALAMCDAIEAISADDVAEIVRSVPAAWLAESERVRITAFLRGRIGCVREACQRLDEVKPPWT